MFSARFTITNRILKYVSEIETAREIVDNLVIAPEWETKFKEDALIRSVHHGTHMDGNSLTINLIEKIVKDEPGRDEKAEDVAKKIGIVGSEKDIQEIINYRNALRFVEQLTRLSKKTGVETFGEKELQQIHSLLMEKIVASHLLGVYRTTAPKDELNSFVKAPLPVEVPYQMDDFWYWLKRLNPEEIHPLFKAAMANFELLRVQPFVDGNGRTVRIFTELLLMADGYNSKFLYSFGEFFDENMTLYKNSYIDTLAKKGEYTLWIEFFVGALANEMSRVKERVRRLSLEGGVKIKQSGKQIALTERQIALMEYLEMKEELSMAEARKVLPMVSDDTILRDLTALVNKKLVKKKGRTKGAKYILRK